MLSLTLRVIVNILLYSYIFSRRLTYICPHIQVDLPAEIGGLIVDENERGCGIGQRLMQHAQQWANEQGCKNILVRSNIARQQAHDFYQKIGYSKIKTSLVFHKVL